MILHGDCEYVLGDIENGSIDALICDPPAGINFMGKKWDGDRGGRDFWVSWFQKVMRLCYFKMKPGAHGFVWALPRTSHWTATALENSGFEIRDIVSHVFGSGFPKSLNVSKAIDKSAGATPDAKKWDGFGTALKPAGEHWILIRKPLSEDTVAKNVLKHGTGAINIDASRVGTSDKLNRPLLHTQSWKNTSTKGVGTIDDKHKIGRFPANFICSGEARDLLDEQAIGYGRSAGGGDTKSKQDKTNWYGKNATAIMGVNNYNDKGGASRFFYCAKTSKAERNTGLDDKNNHPTVKPQKLMRYLCKMITPPGGKILDPFTGSGSTGVAALSAGFEFIGIEKEKEYFDIAKARLDNARVIQT